MARDTSATLGQDISIGLTLVDFTVSIGLKLVDLSCSFIPCACFYIYSRNSGWIRFLCRKLLSLETRLCVCLTEIMPTPQWLANSCLLRARAGALFFACLVLYFGPGHVSRVGRRRECYLEAGCCLISETFNWRTNYYSEVAMILRLLGTSTNRLNHSSQPISADFLRRLQGFRIYGSSA